jgi:hypothetical protein
MGSEPLSRGEQAIDTLLEHSHFAALHELPGLIAAEAARIGAHDALVYLADLQQVDLVPFTAAIDPASLSIDGTLAGRCFQLMHVLTQQLDGDAVRVWLPVLDGTERLGVLTAVLSTEDADGLDDGVLGIRLRRFAALVAEILVTKGQYGDMIVRLRRRAPMSLAAELQWSLLPPLTVSTGDVTVAGALEPAYEVAGDAIDYSVDDNVVRAAVFDAMGHGLPSTQLAAVAVAAYRNIRRAGADLMATVLGVHDALRSTFGGSQFATGLVVELDVATGAFRWVSAGHPPPMLLRDGRFVRTLECDPLPPLGLALPPGA